jgi:hypothetical protein
MQAPSGFPVNGGSTSAAETLPLGENVSLIRPERSFAILQSTSFGLSAASAARAAAASKGRAGEVLARGGDPASAAAMGTTGAEGMGAGVNEAIEATSGAASTLVFESVGTVFREARTARSPNPATTSTTAATTTIAKVRATDFALPLVSSGRSGAGGAAGSGAGDVARSTKAGIGAAALSGARCSPDAGGESESSRESGSCATSGADG